MQWATDTSATVGTQEKIDTDSKMTALVPGKKHFVKCMPEGDDIIMHNLADIKPEGVVSRVQN
jgi:hypothetical protein